MEFFSSFSGFPQSTMVSSRLFVPFPNVHLLLVLNLVGLVCIQFLKLSETRSNIILITYISCSYRYFKDTGVVVGLVFSHFLPFHADANSLLCQVFHSSFPSFFGFVNLFSLIRVKNVILRSLVNAFIKRIVTSATLWNFKLHMSHFDAKSTREINTFNWRENHSLAYWIFPWCCH